MTMVVMSPPLSTLQLTARFSPFLALTSNQKLVFSNGCLQLSHKTWRHSMFVNAKPVVKDRVLSFNGKGALTGIPDNVVVTPWSNSSIFLGATSLGSDSRHVFKLGHIKDARLLSLFRFKVWWMIPRVGNSASDIPIETQMLLVEAREEHDESTSYIVFLPVLDGVFRSSLQGNLANELQVCVESGDPDVVATESLKAVFVNYGDHPFDLMKESMKILEKHTGTFAMPGMLDWFGWCTWDAFYHDVSPQGIKAGLKSLSEGGTPPRFLIIDDGWQDTTNEFQKEGEPYVEGSQFGARLMSIEENNKFRWTSEPVSNTPSRLKELVSDLKKTFGLKYVYVWHALMGYWGGLHPDAPGTKKYNPTLKFPVQSPGNLSHMRDGSMDAMEEYGVGVIDPAKISEFYDDLHTYLVSQDVDGVKVDVQNILETVAYGSGGRISLTRRFQQSLEKSIAKNFQDNSIICCMGQSTDSIYQYDNMSSNFLGSVMPNIPLKDSKQSAITRVSDDYYPNNPTTQTLHIAAVAYNSILFGEVVIPDWDMFYSRHNAAEFHSVARAVGGCGVYVSDKPGQHDFKILQRLVLPNGSVLRAKYPGRPSRDCLFCDPVMDGRSLLKIWNLNKFTGVLGVFNCQGAGSWPCKDSTIQREASPEISGMVSPLDIEYLEEVAGKSWTGDCAVFSFNSGSLSRLPKQEQFEVTLKTLHCNVFTVSPIKVYNYRIQFAPIGLLDMYNSGGAIEAIEVSSSLAITIKGRGAGRFGAYSHLKPRFCSVNSKEEGFLYTPDDCLLTINIPSGTSSWELTVSY
ncbi:hypothetical protein RJ640_010219 [Escallonia rubra]|uniref:galactinol--sucrose galactosyltransferase n=1 Tax=Escallonia rubra TaxID=112253 RepID=A0AA88RKE3_9ASTE|nr:hypothetical protein RJ640_010219 [Escallonia rubra]